MRRCKQARPSERRGEKRASLKERKRDKGREKESYLVWHLIKGIRVLRKPSLQVILQEAYQVVIKNTPLQSGSIFLYSLCFGLNLRGLFLGNKGCQEVFILV